MPDSSHSGDHTFHYDFLSVPPPTPTSSPQEYWSEVDHSAQEVSNLEDLLENSSSIDHQVAQDLDDLQEWLDDCSTYSDSAPFGPIFNPADEKDLNRRGLLLYPSPEERREGREGFCRVSREWLLSVDVETKDETNDGKVQGVKVGNMTWADIMKGKVQEEQKQDGFELWGALPAELKLSVLDFCADREVLGLCEYSSLF